MLSNDLRDFLARARAQHGAAVLSLDELRARHADAEPAELWGLAALRGRFVELSARGATATLTAAFELVLEAQTTGEPVAWISLAKSTFYPPDAADGGVDLAAMVVVRAPGAIAAARAAERLLRSGAFGLVILDLDGAEGPPVAERLAQPAELSMSIQGRLVTLAQAHDAAVVCITEKSADTASLGSLVSLRAEALRSRDGEGRFGVTVRALKDKRRGPGWTRASKLRGPPGL
ncbi:MAG: recombinase A [Deltaproteobacteria bacterium]|nr:recombinase A [Deltaproteobacteria bacterium]MCW5802830.1 recombinase A [Deltaproteobacteria bacterium]